MIRIGVGPGGCPQRLLTHGRGRTHSLDDGILVKLRGWRVLSVTPRIPGLDCTLRELSGIGPDIVPGGALAQGDVNWVALGIA